MAIEFVVQPKDLTQALRFIRPTPLGARRARSELVNVYTRKSEIEFILKNTSSTLPAQVVSRGHATAPVLVFEWFRKVVKTLPQSSVCVSITDGQMKADNLTYSHPDISVQAHPRKKCGK